MTQVATVTTADGSLLRSVRTVLAEADEATLCVAFASEPGVHLLSKELKRLGPRARLLATTVFGGRTPAALDMAAGYGTQVRYLNPTGTYHPKAYLGRTSRSGSCMLGSANLTAGLVTNVEAGVAQRQLEIPAH